MRVLHLYRPRLPATRAQSIQVLRTCHALAELGHEVTLFADRGQEPETLWEQMGLEPHAQLRIHLAPTRHAGLSGIWFRRGVRKWWSGPPGVVLARDKRRLLKSVKAHGKNDHKIVLESHELDSLAANNAVDSDVFHLEHACLSVADALIANCPGTLSAWKEHHSIQIPSTVCHNATHVQAHVSKVQQEGVVVLGSMRTNKGVESIIAAAQCFDVPFRWIGGTDAERKRWGNKLNLEPPVHHANIEHVLREAKVLLLPLGDNPFSHRFTSPLKLWDYLATDQPIVAASTDAVTSICRDFNAEVFGYEPDNPTSIQRAITRALKAPKREPIRRTWAQRAREISTVFTDLQ